MDAINSCNVLIQNARKKNGFRAQKVELGLLSLQTNKAQKVYLTRFGLYMDDFFPQLLPHPALLAMWGVEMWKKHVPLT